MILRWRSPDPAIKLRWRGPAGMLDAVRRGTTTDIAGFLVPAADFPDGITRAALGLKIVGDELRLNIAALPLAPEN